MDTNMFCFQCEQTAGCSGCTGKAGVCGKSAQTAQIQDQLTGALIGLAHAANGSLPEGESIESVMIESLFATLTNVNFDDDALKALLARVHEKKAELVPGCGSCMSSCGHNDDYDMTLIWDADEDIRSLKSLILFGIRGMSAYAYLANVLDYEDDEVNRIYCEA